MKSVKEILIGNAIHTSIDTVCICIGIAVMDSAQQKSFHHWFGAGGLAFAFGLESARDLAMEIPRQRGFRCA